MATKGGLEESTVDASEYEPQVVELPTETEETKESEGSAVSAEGSNITGFAPKEEKPLGASRGRGGRYLYEGLGKEERLEIWRKKLRQMQQDYLASLSELEREDFLKRLEV